RRPGSAFEVPVGAPKRFLEVPLQEGLLRRRPRAAEELVEPIGLASAVHRRETRARGGEPPALLSQDDELVLRLREALLEGATLVAEALALFPELRALVAKAVGLLRESFPVAEPRERQAGVAAEAAEELDLVRREC